VPECTPVRGCILSRSQCFWFLAEKEPAAESRLRSVQEPTINFKVVIEIFVVLVVAVEQNGID